jgi:Ca2+/H+ antiporter, TMEM165/GDT1 family
MRVGSCLNPEAVIERCKPCLYQINILRRLDHTFMPITEQLSITVSTFTLISLAEIGDKSQLVCITLASRHRHWPILLGAATAFALLNFVAVVFGAGIATWVPEKVSSGLVAVLFAGFGIHALRIKADCESEQDAVERPGHGIFLTTLLLLLVAELGDKTQIAVAGLAMEYEPVSVWIGATLALTAISGLGVWAGCTILRRLSLMWLHRIGGGVFLLFAILAAWRAMFY